MAEKKDEFDKIPINMDEEIEDDENILTSDDLKYSFYAPHLLYLLLNNKEEELKLKKPKGKPGRKKKGEEEEFEDKDVLYSREIWKKIRPTKKILGPIEEKFQKQYKDLYDDENKNSIPSRGINYLDNLKKLNGVIHSKAIDLWKIIRRKLPITLEFDKTKNNNFTITIENLNDFNKLIKSPIDSLRVINRKEFGLKKHIKELNKQLEEKEEENNNLKMEKEVEIKNIKNDLAKYNNKQYKHYIEHPEDIDAKIKEIKAKMSETTDNDELNRLEEEENTLIAINNLHIDLDDLNKQLNKIEEDNREIINSKDLEIIEKGDVIRAKDEEVKEKEKVIAEQKGKIEEGMKAVAYQKSKRHEAEVKVKNARDELKDKSEQQKPTYEPSNTPPTLKNYIKDKVLNKSYSLEKDELMNVIEKDINEHKLPKDIDVSKLADTIYLQGAKYINKHMERIKSLVKLTGYDNDLYNKLPPELADEIQKYIHDKALEDIRKKNIRYILPKEMPRWEKAVNKGINPMLGRGAWSK